MTVISRALETLFDILPGHVRIADASGMVLRSNRHATDDGEALPTLRALWERERPTKVGATEPLAFVETPAMRALAGIAIEQERLKVRRNGVAVEVESSAVPIRDEDGVVIGVLLVDQDVQDSADPRDADGSAAGDSSQDRHLSMAAKLAAGIMHDVNNALSPIMGAAFLLQRNAESPEVVRDYAERIRIAAESGVQMTARVARFIRQEPLHEGGGRTVDIAALVNDVLDECETSESGVDIVRDVQPDVRVDGLRDELRAAIRNVVQNAMEAMPIGGRLHARVSNQGDDATVIFTDTGAGMTEQTRERALDPFFSTKHSARSGMGLAETYGITRRHRGTLDIASSREAGTTVTLRFPRAGSKQATNSPAVPAVKQSDSENLPSGAGTAIQSLHVLVVEDDDAGREFLQRILLAEGHRVDSATNCEEAQEKLAIALESPYHVMLTDVSLPDGDGWALAAYARERMPALRIGVITGWEETMRKPESGEVEFVMKKPLRAAELLAIIAGRQTSTTIG